MNVRTIRIPRPAAVILLVIVMLAAVRPVYSVDSSCAIQEGPCIQDAGNLQVMLDIQPKPVAAMQKLTFFVNLTRDGKAVTDASSIILDLSMPGMYMGLNRPKLERVGEGRYQATGIITRCMSGRRTWQAEVTVTRPGGTSSTAFVFEVK